VLALPGELAALDRGEPSALAELARALDGLAAAVGWGAVLAMGLVAMLIPLAMINLHEEGSSEHLAGGAALAVAVLAAGVAMLIV